MNRPTRNTLLAMPIVLTMIGVHSCTKANAGYVSYSQFATYSRHSQILYVSGAADGFAAANDHLNHCLAEKLKMNATEITTNILNFGATRPALHSLNMSQVVLLYLGEACPAPKAQ